MSVEREAISIAAWHRKHKFPGDDGCDGMTLRQGTAASHDQHEVGLKICPSVLLFTLLPVTDAVTTAAATHVM